MNKQKTYRQKRISEGKCPHCGKSCAPFYECEERREYKRISRKGEIIPDYYIKLLLKQNTTLKNSDITDELVEFKRNHLRAFRLTKSLQVKIKQKEK